MNNNKPYLSKLLSFDEINNIFEFLDLKSLVAFTKTTKNIRTCAQIKLVWYNALMKYLPEYPPFSVSQNEVSLSCCALEKLQTFITHRFSIAIVANRLKTFEPRFLHRSMTSSYNGETYVFGGVDCRGHAYSDCWKVIVNESTYSIHLRKIDTTIVTSSSSSPPRMYSNQNQPDQYRDHPGSTSASATCVMHDGSPVVFGGIVDGMFSSQFWRLQLHHKNNQGKWINCRLPHATSDDDMPWMADMVLAAAAVEEGDDYPHHPQNMGVHEDPPPMNHPQQQIVQHVQQQLTAFFLGTDQGLGQGQGLGLDVVNAQPIIDHHQEHNDEPLPQHEEHHEHIQQYQPPPPITAPITAPIHQGLPPPITAPITEPIPTSTRYRTPPGRWGHSLISYDRFLFLFGGSRPGEGRPTSYPTLFLPFSYLFLVCTSYITPYPFLGLYIIPFPFLGLLLR